MFRILRNKYPAPEGAPIVRIPGELSGVAKVIYRGQGPGARNPEGVWIWLGRKRNDPRTAGRHLTNLEIYMRSKDCSVVKSHKSDESISKNCMSVDFMGNLKEPDSEFFQEISSF